MTITHTNNERQGEFVAFEGDERVGYISYEWVDNNCFAILHTVVSPEHKGKGIAKILLDAAADYARKHNKKIKDVCSFVTVQFERNDKYKDVKA
ncbi:GNAT family N-acetyltransferase [Hoylesella shahii]|jgi:acetyltransferase, GNAT family|uniref:GNAT family N-acetyltransferase n=1 Tax=Hoylesella shahii TaxID=228603 RepID=UPI001CAF2AF0|nr:GNAT family N-acetyltransferase [Hoylesella shahii]MBF1575759.1 N-acetyltransferase [Hoylesella shahii]